jgi:hypothetical protein
MSKHNVKSKIKSKVWLQLSRGEPWGFQTKTHYVNEGLTFLKMGEILEVLTNEQGVHLSKTKEN